VVSLALEMTTGAALGGGRCSSCSCSCRGGGERAFFGLCSSSSDEEHASMGADFLALCEAPRPVAPARCIRVWPAVPLSVLYGAELYDTF